MENKNIWLAIKAAVAVTSLVKTPRMEGRRATRWTGISSAKALTENAQIRYNFLKIKLKGNPAGR